MPKLTYQFITIIAITLLCFPVLAEDAEDPAKKLVQELEIRESKTAARDMPGWKKPEKIVMLLPESRVPTRTDFMEWLQSAAGNA